MPTVFRFLSTLALLAGAVLAAMLALATLVEPRTRELTVPVPIETPANPAASP